MFDIKVILRSIIHILIFIAHSVHSKIQFATFTNYTIGPIIAPGGTTGPVSVSTAIPTPGRSGGKLIQVML